MRLVLQTHLANPWSAARLSVPSLRMFEWRHEAAEQSAAGMTKSVPSDSFVDAQLFGKVE